MDPHALIITHHSTSSHYLG
ncbi:hypothetical protein PENVUL_c017G06136 [Penicillium vulpinum]|uniref:Uncharacterized protein n=1 Tax=Penicillium vulpinum TaxID=29845 RepID=A0A1V6RYK7_9EURO|nr:hypothetical protein PENVUL_c017G06136 [Penicillium vulpinum]